MLYKEESFQTAEKPNQHHLDYACVFSANEVQRGVTPNMFARIREVSIFPFLASGPKEAELLVCFVLGACSPATPALRGIVRV